MLFKDLALTGWSYEKADKRIPIEELDLPGSIRARNPVPATYVYSDDTTWKERLINHVKEATKMAHITDEGIQGFIGVHNGYHKHIEGASPVVMAAFPGTTGFMFDMSLGCASVILAAQIAGLHVSDPSIQNLAVGSVQMTTQYTDKCTDGNCLFADSIGAMIFSRANTGNMIRYTEISSNAEFRDMFGWDDQANYTIKNLHKGRALSTFMVSSFGSHLKNACKALKIFPKDIDYIAISASTHYTSKMIIDKIGFDEDRTGLECLTEVPHMGTNDLLFQIERGIEKGYIKEGSKILVSGTALGFSIGTMAIEWGI